MHSPSPDEDVLARVAEKVLFLLKLKQFLFSACLQLSTVCLTMGEYPYIRHTNTSLASDLASFVQKKLRGVSAEERDQLTVRPFYYRLLL